MAKKLEELAFIDRAGFHIADFEDFLEFNRDAMKRIYGADINLDADSQDGQLVTHIAQSQYDLAVLCAMVFNAYSPLTATGESSICQNIFPGLINTYGEINGVSSRPT